MLKNKVNFLNTHFLLIGLMFFSTGMFAQTTEEKAIEYFNSGNYQLALPLMSDFYKLYTTDNDFQYYYGVCLTQTGKYGNTARKILLQSLHGNVPVDAYFYVGMNYHALNDFKNALKYYDIFADNARRKEKKAVNFKEFYSNAQQQINTLADSIFSENNALSMSDSLSSQTASNETISLIGSDSVLIAPQIKSEDIHVDSFVNVLSDSNIHFVLTSQIVYYRINQFKTRAGRQNFIEAGLQKAELDKVLKKLQNLRDEFNQSTDRDEKSKISTEVIELELESIRLKSESDNKYLQSRHAEMEFWKGAAHHALDKLMYENDSILNNNLLYTDEQNVDSLSIQASIPDSDTLRSVVDTSVASQNSGDDLQQNEPETDDKFDEQQNDKHLVYKVQIGAYSKGLPAYIDKLYKKLSVLRNIDNYTTEDNIVVYTVGELSNYDDALKLQNQIRQEGVKDAFVVAFYNGKRITLSEAKKISTQ